MFCACFNSFNIESASILFRSLFFSDMLFLEGLPALFKTALCLLSHHKDNLLEEQGFENIASYLKNHLPTMSNQETLSVLKEVNFMFTP